MTSKQPSIQAEGWTSLFDAIFRSVNQTKQATRGREVLLVLSDGGDNDSRFTEREIINFVKEADVRIFSISIFDRSRPLEAISEETGGRAFRVRRREELPDWPPTLASNSTESTSWGLLRRSGRSTENIARLR